jgi:hypothetical protein
VIRHQPAVVPTAPIDQWLAAYRRVPQAGRGLSCGHLSGLLAHCPALHERLLWSPSA